MLGLLDVTVCGWADQGKLLLLHRDRPVGGQAKESSYCLHRDRSAVTQSDCGCAGQGKLLLHRDRPVGGQTKESSCCYLDLWVGRPRKAPAVTQIYTCGWAGQGKLLLLHRDRPMGGQTKESSCCYTEIDLWVGRPKKAPAVTQR